ncbi:hypothetical protein KO516_22025 [Citreicella sp. C3M06]|uniref:hypothetical protein n=1 Tax=Citreicella sp. C3M06 TaxID=2841564 RepID=UPI001C08289B|nr:hypothetical protein [Citreicella sp. C3M06]MBU2963454.1 hypothetical protein [Citreicella sp. C3M06]
MTPTGRPDRAGDLRNDPIVAAIGDIAGRAYGSWPVPLCLAANNGTVMAEDGTEGRMASQGIFTDKMPEPRRSAAISSGMGPAHRRFETPAPRKQMSFGHTRTPDIQDAGAPIAQQTATDQ